MVGRKREEEGVEALNLHFRLRHCKTVCGFLQQPNATSDEVPARREPQRSPAKHSRGALKHFRGPLWPQSGGFIFKFFFQNGAFWCTLYF